MSVKKPDPYKLDAGAPAPDAPDVPDAQAPIRPAGGAVRPHDKEPDPYGVSGEREAPAAQAKAAAPQPAAAAASEPPATGGGRFTSQVMGGVHVIALTQSDIIDGRDIEQLGDDIYHFIKAIDAPRLVLDLEKVQHLSSAALGMLIALKKVVDKRDGKICIANVSPDIQKIFKLTKLNKVLKIHGDTDKAIKSVL